MAKTPTAKKNQGRQSLKVSVTIEQFIDLLDTYMEAKVETMLPHSGDGIYESIKCRKAREALLQSLQN